MEYLHRTAITRLVVSRSAEEKLRQLVARWKRGCQMAADVAWQTTHAVGKLQSLVYDRLREQTGLKSEHTHLAIQQAARAVKSCRERESNGRAVTKPEFTSPTVTYDARTMTLFDDGTVSLTTLGKRVRCPLALPDEEDGYQYQYLDDDQWELTESTLSVRDGEFFVHLGFRRPKRTDTGASTENGTVLGVDVGIENLAVTRTARFFSGRELFHRHREFERRRQSLQENGSRNATRALKGVSRRERRYTGDLLHSISREIVEEALAHGCRTIAFEDLTGIRERFPDLRKFHVWAFRRLCTFVAYKAEAVGIEVATVDPAHTSQRCSRIGCECTSVDNRPSRDRFHCRECGFEVNADYNAARNIGLKCVRRDHQSSRRTGVGQCALKSGTLSPGAGFSDKSRPCDG